MNADVVEAAANKSADKIETFLKSSIVFIYILCIDYIIKYVLKQL